MIYANSMVMAKKIVYKGTEVITFISVVHSILSTSSLRIFNLFPLSFNGLESIFPNNGFNFNQSISSKLRQ